ncbi:MAG: hypothetical protein RJA63_3555 [Pseudomonadota bacterium]|jgi:predicted amidohydrolase|nr:carbon-nitrogen hydrolase family protein [Uliginosibacterium sp.]MBK9395569.1 carbon-nitrogen hydrolase family protein [Uliginosibacterium sp.]
MIDSGCRVAALQMISGESLAENLAAAAGLVADAAAQGAQLALLPEYFPLISAHDADKLAISEPYGAGPIQSFLAETARAHRIWIIGGTVPLATQDSQRLRNACLVFNPHGECVARYDKLHLFSFQHGQESYDEARLIEAGNELVSFDGPCGRIGLSVCYDLRFPEMFRRLGELDLIVVPAAFTETTGRAHWEVLLRARAIENQCYVLACGQGGLHPCGRRTFGHSMLIDPWGEVVVSLAIGRGVVAGDVDPARIRAVRDSLPALHHRRFT